MKGENAFCKNAVALLRAAILDPGSANFAGSLLSIFNSFAYLTKDTDEQSMIVRYRGAIAGALAGTSLLVTPKSMRCIYQAIFTEQILILYMEILGGVIVVCTDCIAI